MSTHRIQRRRLKGWRMPAGAVCVTRPGPWGNPFKAEDAKHNSGYPRQFVVDAFRWWLLYEGRMTHVKARAQLAGKALACWCAPGLAGAEQTKETK